MNNQIPQNKRSNYFDIKVNGEGGRNANDAKDFQIKNILHTQKMVNKSRWKR